MIFTVKENVAPGTIIGSLMPANSTHAIIFRSKLTGEEHYPVKLLASGQLVVEDLIDRESTEVISIPTEVIIEVDHASTMQITVVTVYVMVCFCKI